MGCYPSVSKSVAIHLYSLHWMGCYPSLWIGYYPSLQHALNGLLSFSLNGLLSLSLNRLLSISTACTESVAISLSESVDIPLSLNRLLSISTACTEWVAIPLLESVAIHLYSAAQGRSQGEGSAGSWPPMRFQKSPKSAFLGILRCKIQNLTVIIRLWMCNELISIPINLLIVINLFILHDIVWSIFKFPIF